MWCPPCRPFRWLALPCFPVGRHTRAKKVSKHCSYNAVASPTIDQSARSYELPWLCSLSSPKRARLQSLRQIQAPQILPESICFWNTTWWVGRKGQRSEKAPLHVHVLRFKFSGSKCLVLLMIIAMLARTVVGSNSSHSTRGCVPGLLPAQNVTLARRQQKTKKQAPTTGDLSGAGNLFNFSTLEQVRWCVPPPLWAGCWLLAKDGCLPNLF